MTVVLDQGTAASCDQGKCRVSVEAGTAKNVVRFPSEFDVQRNCLVAALGPAVGHGARDAKHIKCMQMLATSGSEISEMRCLQAQPCESMEHVSAEDRSCTC